MLYRRISVILAAIISASALTASSSATPPPSPTPPPVSRSAVEGAKAALVRIELFARSEIAHVDASSGVAEIRRGTSTVPLGSATGVLISADGIVATTWENLAVDDNVVAVQSANDLFLNVIRVPIVGNDNNPQRRGTTPDQYWARHLVHCYDLVEHCVLFKVPQYRIKTYTSKAGSVVAELLNTPSGPEGVALLRITGGGGAPTATLAPAGAPVGAENRMLGFAGEPTIQQGPAVLPVSVDAPASRIVPGQDQNIPTLLDAGISGGPVIDAVTGQIVGLTGPRQPDGTLTLTPAASIQAALAAASLEASPSKFDVVFRSGVDHLDSGNQGGSAVSAFEESLTYYDSALAASLLKEARELGNQTAATQPAADDAAATGNGLPAWVLLAALAGIFVLVVILTAIASRRRQRAFAFHSHNSGQHSKPRQASGTGITSSSTPFKRPVESHGGSREETGERREGPSGPPADHGGPPGADADETRAAGPLALRAAERPGKNSGQSKEFCSRCGEAVRPDARFCIFCGQPVG
jgi:hypothetical protein